VFGFGAARAVSSGYYSPARQHCSTGADIFDNGGDHTAEPGCKNFIFTISDGNGHEYFGVGTRQTPDGTTVNTLDVWIDAGTGKTISWTVSRSGVSKPTITASQEPQAQKIPTSLHLYMGADDNLDFGEHDASSQANNGAGNGPSDGGALVVDINPTAAPAWVATLRSLQKGAILSAPVPGADTGAGACADGFCIALTSQRHLAWSGLNTTAKPRDVANYAGVTWDPYNCSSGGNSDGATSCGINDGVHNGWTLADWYDTRGATYIEPGLQIYEDPDPEGSPGVLSLVGLHRNDPYPLPALYVGSCGVILGGGPRQYANRANPLWFNPKTNPLANSAGQIVLPPKPAC
jgi:hypothetical protein